MNMLNKQLSRFLNYYFLIYFLLKDNCFTEFCCFVSNLNMNQRYTYIPSLLNLPHHFLLIPPL